MAEPGIHCCDEMRDRLDDNETAIRYSPKFREYGIPVLDGGDSFITIQFCPWCGTSLPKSLRTEWFDRLERLRLDIDDPAVPAALLTDEWWRNDGY